MQKEPTFCRIIDILVCVAGKVHPVVLLHCIEHGHGRGLTVCEFCVRQSTLCMSPEILELLDGALQWATTWCSCLTNGKYLRGAVGDGGRRGHQTLATVAGRSLRRHVRAGMTTHQWDTM
ncbi:hypothetical protein AG1IA_10427 [Rhizoctonia solani AG-1 IA]|uniref:Uncharacterized protein n=1 Tax=Thanatephorus cucumeris (strain AG1-IA) TaxID=983506 RepID=L8WFI1_THACA|nr:hypothetical protein AG1IA_10427 [Rhizoctonia solani AG-1 IA]